MSYSTSVNNDFVNSLRAVAENKYSSDSPAPEESLVHIPLYRFPNGINTAGEIVNGKPMNPDMSGYLIVDKDTGDINGLQWGFKSYTGQAAVNKIKALAQEKATDGSSKLGFANNHPEDKAIAPTSVIDILRGSREVDVPNTNYKNYSERLSDEYAKARILSPYGRALNETLAPIIALFTGEPKTIKVNKPVNAYKYDTKDAKRNNALNHKFNQETGWEHLWGA